MKYIAQIVRKLIVFTILILFSSCKTYLDTGQEIHTENYDFTYLKEYNEFIYKSKINAKADHEVYYTTKFCIRLPKKIKNWSISGNQYFFEYNNKEVIYIHSGFINRGDAGEWKVRETNQEEIEKKLDQYWYERKYNENSLISNHPDKISKVYTDGRVIILLYNIKKENFEHYLSLVKQFKYLN